MDRKDRTQAQKGKTKEREKERERENKANTEKKKRQTVNQKQRGREKRKKKSSPLPKRERKKENANKYIHIEREGKNCVHNGEGILKIYSKTETKLEGGSQVNLALIGGAYRPIRRREAQVQLTGPPLIRK